MKQWRAAVEPVIANWNKEHDNWDKLLGAYKDGLIKVGSLK